MDLVFEELGVLVVLEPILERDIRLRPLDLRATRVLVLGKREIDRQEEDG